MTRPQPLTIGAHPHGSTHCSICGWDRAGLFLFHGTLVCARASCQLMAWMRAAEREAA